MKAYDPTKKVTRTMTVRDTKGHVALDGGGKWIIFALDDPQIVGAKVGDVYRLTWTGHNLTAVDKK